MERRLYKPRHSKSPAGWGKAMAFCDAWVLPVFPFLPKLAEKKVGSRAEPYPRNFLLGSAGRSPISSTFAWVSPEFGRTFFFDFGIFMNLPKSDVVTKADFVYDYFLPYGVLSNFSCFSGEAFSGFFEVFQITWSSTRISPISGVGVLRSRQA